MKAHILLGVTFVMVNIYKSKLLVLTASCYVHRGRWHGPVCSMTKPDKEASLDSATTGDTIIKEHNYAFCVHHCKHTMPINNDLLAGLHN